MNPELSINTNYSITTEAIGAEKIPIIIIDNWLNNAEALRRFPPQDLTKWIHPNTLYPGIWANTPQNYIDVLLSTLSPLIKQYFNIHYDPVKASCVYGIITKKPSELSLFQTAPHVDTLYTPQIATVHYLCEENHNGTSFYRHRKTGYETVTLDRWNKYRETLTQELELQKKNPSYINGSNDYFERIKECKVKFNRLLIYPSQALHSGPLNIPFIEDDGIDSARLTINSFIGYYEIGP